MPRGDCLDYAWNWSIAPHWVAVVVELVNIDLTVGPDDKYFGGAGGRGRTRGGIDRRQSPDLAGLNQKIVAQWIALRVKLVRIDLTVGPDNEQLLSRRGLRPGGRNDRRRPDQCDCRKHKLSQAGRESSFRLLDALNDCRNFHGLTPIRGVTSASPIARFMSACGRSAQKSSSLRK